ncbi:MAG: hypothetical protein LUE10_03330, partial [Alistipes sp.]|nr:hypothetical protein [Alistipes sp.]
TLQPHEPYMVRPQVNYLVPEKEEKRRSAGFRALVDFPVGVSHIIPDFRRNPRELEMIDKQFEILNKSLYINIESIYMEGYASPEGGLALNRQLAMERAQALKDYFISIHGLKPEIISINTVTEDWEGLRNIVERWEDGSDKERILSVIDSPEPPEAKERRLRAVHHQWVRLVNEGFPLLRRTEYTIYFTVSDFTVEQSRSLIETHPELFSHYELYMLAMSYDQDPVKRLEVLEKAAIHFPDDEIALVNLAAALMEAGEYTTAKRYLERVGNKALAANNLGVIYLLEGLYQEAESHFTSSPAEESADNLSQLRLKVEDEIKMQRYRNRLEGSAVAPH